MAWTCRARITGKYSSNADLRRELLADWIANPSFGAKRLAPRHGISPHVVGYTLANARWERLDELGAAYDAKLLNWDELHNEIVRVLTRSPAREIKRPTPDA